MKTSNHRRAAAAFATAGIVAALAIAGAAVGDEGHDEPAVEHGMQRMQKMMDEHKDHEHEETFEAMKKVSPEHMREDMRAMMALGLAMPPMDGARGRELFLSKGCIACHSVNGVGGGLGPEIDADAMPSPMNAFEFAARMWRGAPAMIELQEGLMGEAIALSGQELADIIAFAHDKDEQLKVTQAMIPDAYRELAAQ